MDSIHDSMEYVLVRIHAGCAGSATAPGALPPIPSPEQRSGRSSSQRIALGIGLALAIFCLPEDAVADIVFCAPATPLPVLERVVPQLGDGSLSARGTEEEMRLLDDVIDAARQNAKARGSPLAKRLDVIDERLARSERRVGATPSSLLSAEDRSLLVRWHALCGSEPSASDHPGAPGHPAAGDSGADSPELPGGSTLHGKGAGTGQPGSAAPAAETRISTRQATALALGLIILAWVAAKFLGIEDNRGARRYSCQVESGIRFGKTQLATVIVDISQTGCKIQTVRQLSEGSQCRILAGGAWRHGRIIWSNAHYTGVQFKRALEAGDVRDIVRSGSAVGSEGSPPGERKPPRAGGAPVPLVPRRPLRQAPAAEV